MAHIGVYNYSKLRGLIREKGQTQESVANAAKISPATFSSKICGKGLFKQNEITQICKFLDIKPQDIGTYFFNS